LVLSRVRLIRVRLVLVNLNPINDTYTSFYLVAHARDRSRHRGLMSARDHCGGKAPKHPVGPAAVVAADVNVSLDNEFRQHDGVLPIFRRFPNSECSNAVAWAGVDSSHRQVPQTNTRYHIKESSFGGVIKMIRADYRNGFGYQGQPQLKGDGFGKLGRGHEISKDPRVRKQVEWQTFKQVCGWAAVNPVLELVTCHCAGAPLRLGVGTQIQVHVIYRYDCHFAHSMTCPWVATCLGGLKCVVWETR